MANELLINHDFVTAKPDSADASLVSANEWNAALEVSGGVSSDMILRDTASATGARMVQGPLMSEALGSYSGASPSSAIAPLVFNLSTAAHVLLLCNIEATTSNGINCTVTVYRNGVSSGKLFAAPGNGTSDTRAVIFAEPVGSYTYTLVVSVGGGATFTNIVVSLIGLAIGKL